MLASGINASKSYFAPTVSEEAGNGSAWYRLTFQWFTDILYRGNEQNRLDQEDLQIIPLPKTCETKFIMDTFDVFWKQELAKPSPSFVRALFRAFGKDYMVAGMLKLGHDLSIFVGPQVLHAIIVFLRTPEASVWEGLGLTLAVTVSQIAMSLCLRHYFFKVCLFVCSILLLTKLPYIPSLQYSVI